ncbi:MULTISPECIES: hypothetical protein [unclassified Pseudomonas]|uniref:hypothetical protein n=1 Tax=unclassified Pseudomonas TaxID=196821 RepID=UPI002AC930B5|nr:MULTISPECIES: hypothetical protein [unclassified Pseudomonas]MEB0045764.1 hypothetical protein [Pseudomonas sp. Dout3]MEB0098133.1 hypothetical protein [Pseudomonas sp. DC1.2]WPX60134.1 hypothetical protein RHM68_05705 [Pseudomonas sp. DC1.2]
MAKVILEIDAQLYGLLKSSAEARRLSIEEECYRRLQNAERRSLYLQALLAELRAQEEQRLAGSL